MTYFWVCVSAWLALNGTVAVSLLGHYRAERRAKAHRIRGGAR